MNSGQLTGGSRIGQLTGMDRVDVALASTKDDLPLLNILAVDAENVADQLISVFLRLESEVNRLMGPIPENVQIAEKQPHQQLHLPTDRINHASGQNVKLIADIHGQIHRLSRL